jgi:glycosyltransferase involved in cell wall biosynthesis
MSLPITATDKLTPIRVARIIDRLNIGGPAKHVSWLSAGMNEQAFHTTLVTGVVPEGEGDMSYFARAAGIEPVIIEEMSRELGLRDIVVITKLVRLLFKLKPQIIHTHKAKAGAAGRVAALIYKWLTPSALWFRPRPCRIVHTFHGHIFHSYYGKAKTKIFILIESLLGRFCTDKIVTISQQQRREIADILDVKQAKKFQVIPLGLDFSELENRQGTLRKEYGIAQDEVLIGIVGRLCEVKNHSMFLRAAARLLQNQAEQTREATENKLSFSAIRFVIIGDGHLRQTLEAEAAALGIAGQVIFTGFREDVGSLYADLDIVALTSLNEGTPLTLIEAMSCGRAVVATKVGGVVDILGTQVETGQTFSICEHGLNVASGDVEGFAQALHILIEQAEMRQEMGKRGQQFVKSQLSKTRLINDMEKLYRELLGIAVPQEAVKARRNVRCS